MLAPWAYLASVMYHDSFWYPTKGRSVMREVLTSDWGRLFRGWEQASSDERGYQLGSVPASGLRRTGLRALLTSFGILGTCLKEAPEFSNRRRHVADRP